jgi:hypothetical protein
VASLLTDGTYVTQSKVRLTVSRHDHGRYIRCEAANEMPSRPEDGTPSNGDVKEQSAAIVALPPQVAQLSLRVEFAPVVAGWPSDGKLKARQGSDVNISCPFTANPSQLVSITWLKESTVIEDHASSNINSTSSSISASNNMYEYSDSGDRSSSSSKYWTWEGAAWLLIRNLSASDKGDYACVVENRIGFGRPDRPLTLEILSPPLVRLTMDPPSPIRETDRVNVTLTCVLVDGNPARLTRVSWFMDGLLLTELPQCDNREQEEEEMCGVDPSKLILEDGKREFHGNFSCIGENSVGRSPQSAVVELQVMYPPGPATLRASPARVYKGERLRLTCEAGPGRPASHVYSWTLGGQLLAEGETSPTLEIYPVSLNTSRANISCRAVNAVGPGGVDHLAVAVQARPWFLRNLAPYTGSLGVRSGGERSIRFACQVECAPRCHIAWLRNEVPVNMHLLPANNNMSAADQLRTTAITVEEEDVAEDPLTNTFPSVLSVLTFHRGDEAKKI